LKRAERAASECDIFFSVGTSGIVQPAASLPYIARRGGAFVVEINPEPTEITYITDESLCGKSGEILPIILDKIKSARNRSLATG